MRRIAIFGPPGSGKSTLARALGEALRLEVIHLDRYFWRPGWVQTPRDEWVQIQESLVAGPEWIIDGNYSGTLEVRLRAADTVIYIEEKSLRCVWRILARVWRSRGRPRPDLNPGCPERLRWDIISFAWFTFRFNRRSRPGTLKALRECEGRADVFILKGRRGCESFLSSLPAPNAAPKATV